MNRTPVKGLVVSSSGEPVAGALIVIVEATVPMPEIALVADDRGRFTIHLPDGNFRLRAERRGLEGEADVTIPGEHRVCIEIT